MTGKKKKLSEQKQMSRRPRLRFSFVRKWWFIPALLLIIGLIAAATILFWPKQSVAYSSSVDSCASNATYNCYKQELTYIVQHEDPAKAFVLLKQQYSQVPYVKTTCHQLTHIVGQVAYNRYGDLGTTYEHGDHFCWGGYYHGAMEAVADKLGYDYISKHANAVCASIAAKQRYSFDHYNCVHGLGHGFMEIQGNNIFFALSSCDKLTDTWESSSCYGGVFMQNIMEEQTPDMSKAHGSKYLHADQPMYPCTAVGTKYKEQCYMMQTSFALQIVNYDFSKVFGMCANIDTAYIATCYQSVGRDASGQSSSAVDSTRETCYLGADFDAKSNCVIGAVKDFISYFHGIDEATKFCNSLTPDLQPVCTATATDYYKTF